MPEVVLETATGTFSLDAVSGGISAIIDMAWQIYMYSTIHSEFVTVVDEPENHLHPQLQRTLLPSFLRAFPKVQFIVATHNPFMVTSVPESHVYVLDFNEGKRVFSRRLDTVNKAGTAGEILRDVLGLDGTLPIWAEAKLEEVFQRYASSGLTVDGVRNVRRELAALGLDEAFPATIERLADRLDD